LHGKVFWRQLSPVGKPLQNKSYVSDHEIQMPLQRMSYGFQAMHKLQYKILISSLLP
jgi:hypothetical protein